MHGRDGAMGVTGATAGAIATVALRFGSTDCERFHPGFAAQPVNAWSSLAFLVAGCYILYGAFRQPEARKELVAFGLLVGANAIGSFVYHGPAFAWGHWAHDVPAVGIPLFVAIHDLGLVRGWPVSRRLLFFGVTLSLVGLILVPLDGAAFALACLLVPAAGVGELAAYRAGYRPRLSDGWSSWTTAWVIVILSLVMAVGAFLFGRTDSSFCSPGSVFQYHAAWHVLSAVSAAAFAFAGLEHGPARISGKAEAD